MEVKLKKYNTGYTQVLNEVIYNKTISLRAKGLYAYLFSKPDEWQFHWEVMATEIQETKGQMYPAIKELIEAGYIMRKQAKSENGVFGGIIYEFLEPCAVSPCAEKTVYGKTSIHNNTDILSNTDNKKKEIYKESFEKFWKEFPKERIGNKDKAYSAWKRAIKEKRTTEEEIIQAAKQYSQSEEVKRGYAKGCQAWINDDRFKVKYTKEENQTEEKTIKIAIGEFYLDNSMADYKDVTVGMTDDQCEKLWKWIYDKHLGEELKQSYIKEIIRKYNKKNLDN